MPEPSINIASLAGLARMDVTPDEAKVDAARLPRVVEYVSQLQSVTTDNVAAAPVVRPLRPDISEISAARDRILEAAPARQDDFWKVKAVFE